MLIVLYTIYTLYEAVIIIIIIIKHITRCNIILNNNQCVEEYRCNGRLIGNECICMSVPNNAQIHKYINKIITINAVFSVSQIVNWTVIIIIIKHITVSQMI